MNVTFPLMHEVHCHTCCNRFQAWNKTFPFELETVSSPCIIMGIVPHLLVYWSSEWIPCRPAWHTYLIRLCSILILHCQIVYNRTGFIQLHKQQNGMQQRQGVQRVITKKWTITRQNVWCKEKKWKQTKLKIKYPLRLQNINAFTQKYCCTLHNIQNITLLAVCNHFWLTWNFPRQSTFLRTEQLSRVTNHRLPTIRICNSVLHFCRGMCGILFCHLWIQRCNKRHGNGCPTVQNVEHYRIWNTRPRTWISSLSGFASQNKVFLSHHRANLKSHM